MNKNNKYITLILAFALIGVWGTIAYRIMNSISSKNRNEGIDMNEYYGNTGAGKYEYIDDVKDPFQMMPTAKKQYALTNKTVKLEPIIVLPPYTLNGVIIDKKRKVVILESQDGLAYFLSEGDSLQGLTISEITAWKVDYIYHGKMMHWRIEHQ